MDRATALVQNFDTLSAQMQHVRRKETLRLAIPFTVHHHFFDKLEQFAQANADTLDLVLIDRTDSECHTLFESGAVDMAISHIPFTAGIDSGEVIAVSPLRIVMRKDNPLASRKILYGEDINSQPLIYYMNGYSNCFWLDENVPVPTYAVSDILLAYELVWQGRGIFPVPILSLPGFTGEFALVPFQGLDDKDVFRCSIAAHTQMNSTLLEACLVLRQFLGQGEER